MNADAVARAICAAAKETGADPVDVLLGNDRSPGYPVKDLLQVSRARAYAGRALDRVFNTPKATVVPRPMIAKSIGVNKPSWYSFFTNLIGRPTPWWSPEALGRVISAIEGGRVLPEPETAPVVTPSPEPVPPEPPKPPEPAPKPVLSPGQRFRGYGRSPIGTLEHDGFRPAPDTARKVLEDDKDDRRVGPYVPVGRPLPRKDDDFLRRAVLNTAKMTPPPEE